MKQFFAALGLLLVSGCTFQSNQLNALRAMWDKPSRSEVTWLATYGNDKASVIAVNHEPFIVFVNSNDVAIAFDGWQVRSVVGFGLTQPLKIDYEAGSPRFSGRKSVEEGVYKHRCDPWQYKATQVGGKWLQRCKADFYYDNVIVLDKEGAIVQISQVVDGSGTRVILEKLNG